MIDLLLEDSRGEVDVDGGMDYVLLVLRLSNVVELVFLIHLINDYSPPNDKS